MAELVRWSARQSADVYGPGVLTALGAVVDLGPVRLGELAARVGVLPAGISRTVAVLEGDHLVQRTADPTDGRASFISATAAGSQLIRARRRDRGDKLACHLSRLDDNQRDALRAAIDAIEELTAH
jgi:DNA-binding MarR family transcriptional regulator